MVITISRRLEPLSDGPGVIPRPVVLATSDGRHAMGIYAPPQSRANTAGPNYGRWRFNAERIVKWNCIFRVHFPAGLPPGDYSYRMRVPVHAGRCRGNPPGLAGRGRRLTRDESNDRMSNPLNAGAS